MRFAHYPKAGWTWILAVAIYVNFFSHHYLPDARYVILAAYVLIFWKCMIHFRVRHVYYRMPYIVASSLTAGFVWVAENIGTLTHTWAYPGQGDGWHMVSLYKLWAWLLLLIISFVVVSLVIKPKPPKDA